MWNSSTDHLFDKMGDRTTRAAPGELGSEQLNRASHPAGQPGTNRECVLDVGCGPYKVHGAIGIDHTPAPGVDVVYDLDCYPWPFASDAFDRAICRHSLAHLVSVVRAMEELHRILRPGGLLEIVTPHFSSDNAFTDITSRWFFGLRSMDFFCDNRRLKYGYGHVTFQLLEARISFRQAVIFEPDERKPNPLKAIGVESLINRFPRFYEHFLAFVLRANELYFRLRAIKQAGDEGLA